MIDRIREQRRDGGFTLVELLIVIVILGILAAVVAVAVSGISDRGQSSACDTDLQNLRTAQEAYYAQNSTFANEHGLKGAGLLSEYSTYHDITVGADSAAATAATNAETSSVTGAAYVVKYADAACGTVGNAVS